MDEEKCVKKNVAKKVKCGIVAGIFICLIMGLWLINSSKLCVWNVKKVVVCGEYITNGEEVITDRAEIAEYVKMFNNRKDVRFNEPGEILGHYMWIYYYQYIGGEVRVESACVEGSDVLVHKEYGSDFTAENEKLDRILRPDWY